MNKKAPGILVLLSFAGLLLLPRSTSAQDAADKPSAQPVILKWLGTAGWKITIGETVILIDPFLTRRAPDRSGGEWQSDEDAVLKYIRRADYIFTGHSHADHIGDVACIANKFGSKVYGSEKTVSIERVAGVPESQLLTIHGGETYDFNGFSVRVIDSVHGVLNRTRLRLKSAPRPISRPCPERVPASLFSRPGQSLLYLFNFGNFRVLHQSTGGFIADKLAGLRADHALLYPMKRDDTESILKILQPKAVYLHHFDQWRAPFSSGVTERSLNRARRFTRDANAIDSSIDVVTPSYFKPYPIR